MRQRVAQGLGLSSFALLISAAGLAPLRGQDPRDACLAQLRQEVDTVRQRQLLLCSVNPSAGPPRGAWPVGVQWLASSLIERGQDSVAAAWLRWAVRLSPDLQPDTVQLLPRVVAAYRNAREYVSRTRTRGEDTTVSISWLWPTSATAEKDGKLQVAASAPGLRVDVVGVGLIGQGGSVPLAPGSYQIAATSPGYDSVRVTREIMPGVTTLLQFHLRAPADRRQVVQQQRADTTQRRFPPAEQKAGIPAWVKVGAGAGVVWAILWNAYIKSH